MFHPPPAPTPGTHPGPGSRHSHEPRMIPALGSSHELIPAHASYLAGKMSEKSFDPEASQHGLMAGAEYDPSVDFVGRDASRSQTAAAEFDPVWQRALKQPTEP